MPFKKKGQAKQKGTRKWVKNIVAPCGGEKRRVGMHLLQRFVEEELRKATEEKYFVLLNDKVCPTRQPQAPRASPSLHKTLCRKTRHTVVNRVEKEKNGNSCPIRHIFHAVLLPPLPPFSLHFTPNAQHSVLNTA